MSAARTDAAARQRRSFFEAYGGNGPLNYERFFVPAIGGPLADDLMTFSSIEAGMRVLDVGCGTGVVARLAAARVGAGGSVTGLDPNPGMLAVARSVTSDQLPIDWQQATAEQIPSPDESFDIVLSQLALQFVGDKAAALAEMRRVLSPVGRLVLSVGGPPPRPFAILEEEMERHAGAEAAAFVRTVFSLNDPRGLERLIRDAGFRDVSAREMPRELRLPPPRDYLWQYVASTPLAGLLAQKDEHLLAELERAIVKRLQPFVQDGGTRVSARTIVATALK